MQLNQNNEMLARQREFENRQRDMNKKIAEENLRLAEQQQNKRRQSNKDAISNAPTQDFFSQFGTSYR